jgi:metallo-beta-lactamase class B
MAEDVPALKAMMPGGKEHPVNRILHDGDTVTLGGVTLTAHLTPGHTRGCTTFTSAVNEAGRSYNVVFSCSLRAPTTLTPPIVDEMTRSFRLVRTLPCDIQVGDHPAQFQMYEKYERLKKAGPGGPNPFVDPAGCNLETDIQEAMFKAVLAKQ